MMLCPTSLRGAKSSPCPSGCVGFVADLSVVVCCVASKEYRCFVLRQLMRFWFWGKKYLLDLIHFSFCDQCPTKGLAANRESLE
jgi:hypothetical protein